MPLSTRQTPERPVDSACINRACPLCDTADGSEFARDSRDYFRCRTCQLIFVPPHQFLASEEEKAVYDYHENDPADPRYRNFLSRLFDPMATCVAPASRGLDFGSGPGPTLSVMFEEAGHSMQIYDAFYAPDPAPLSQQYDFITASEVAEHLYHPQYEFDRLWKCLQPGGHFGVMTTMAVDRAEFGRWHYKNDPTHVCFYSIATFQWLADRWSAALVVVNGNVVVFEKPQ